jgi:hypothetical protein
MTDDNFALDPKFMAGVALIGRTGAKNFRVGYSDPDDGEPTVWYAAAGSDLGGEAGAALDPVKAVMRLCEQLIDGGTCTHCHQLTIFDDNPGVYAWDPELATFRRGCEGDAR